MLYKNNLKIFLSSKEPLDSLRQYAIDLNKEGLNKEEVYNIFYDYYLELQENNDEIKANILGDVMDMITGWYVGRNIDL